MGGRNLCLALFACLWATAAPARDLVIGITQFPSSLHPSLDSMLAKSYVLAMTQRPITAYDHDWRLRCFLCTELPDLDNGRAVLEPTEQGGRGVAVRYTLRPEVFWGDGTPVSTRDVVFTWEVGRHPQSGVAGQELYRRILAIDVHDERSFTVHQDRVSFEYQALNGFELLPAHLEAEIFAADPAEYRNRSLYRTAPTTAGLYFGPYRITAVEAGARIVLNRNPTWTGKEPAFDRIIVRTIENTAALEANLLSGEIDYIAGELGLSLDQAVAFEARHRKRFRVLYQPGLIYEHIELNLDNPVLADRRVRQALLMGIDRQAISEQLFGGRQPVAHTNVSPLDWMHDSELSGHDFDPAAAGRLLDEAGWRRRGTGPRRNAAGQALRLEFMTTAGNRSRELVQQVLQSQWRELGVEVTIRNEPARVFFGQTVNQRRFSALAMFAWISAPESVPRSTLHSEEIPSEANAWSGQNYGGYRNAEVDALLDAIEVELDREHRGELWRRLQRIYARELPALPLFYRADAHVLPPWLKGVRPTGHQYPSTLWVEDWHRDG